MPVFGTSSIELDFSPLLVDAQNWRLTPTRMIVSPKMYKYALWEFEEYFKWEGRDQRRIKRERRRFLRAH